MDVFSEMEFNVTLDCIQNGSRMGRIISERIYANKKVKSPISPPYPKTCDYNFLSFARTVLYHPRLPIDQSCQEKNYKFKQTLQPNLST